MWVCTLSATLLVSHVGSRPGVVTKVGICPLLRVEVLIVDAATDGKVGEQRQGLRLVLACAEGQDRHTRDEGGPMSSRRELEAAAYHAAGHAVMRGELSRRPLRVTISQPCRHRQAKIGVDWLDANNWRLHRWSEAEIMCALAGPEAERQFAGRRNGRRASADDGWAWQVALWSEGFERDDGQRARALLAWLTLKTRAWISASLVWPQVEAVAMALLARQTLSGAEVSQVCGRALKERVPKATTSSSPAV